MNEERGIFGQLMEEHEEVSSIIRRLKRTGDDDLERREQLFTELRINVLAHARAEQETFYPQVRDINEETRDEVADDLEEHETIEELVRRLDRMALDDDRWIDTLEELEACIEHHVDDEESDLFPEVRANIGARRADRLKEDFLEARARYVEQLDEQGRERRDLEEMTKDELYEMAQAFDIHGRSDMNKEELVRQLRNR